MWTRRIPWTRALAAPGSPSARTDARRTAAAGLLALAIIARVVANVASADGALWDFVNIYNTADRVWHHEWTNLYHSLSAINGHPPYGKPQRGFDYIGFPLSALLFGPLGAFRPRTALLAFKLFCAFCFGAGVAVLYRGFVAPAAGERPGAWTLPVVLASLLLFEPAWFLFAIGGQATAVAFLFLALFSRTYVAGNTWLAAACYCAAVLFKPFLAPGLLLVVPAGDWRLLRALVTCFAVAGLISLAAFGLQVHLEWLHMVQRWSTAWAENWWNNAAIFGVLAGFWKYLGDVRYWVTDRTIPPALLAIKAAWTIVTVAAFVVWARVVRSRGPALVTDREELIVLPVLLPLVLSAMVWPHYLVFALVVAAVAVRHWRELPHGARALVLLLVLSGTHMNHWFIAFVGRHVTINTVPEVLAFTVLSASSVLCALALALALRFAGPRPAPPEVVSPEPAALVPAR